MKDDHCKMLNSLVEKKVHRSKSSDDFTAFKSRLQKLMGNIEDNAVILDMNDNQIKELYDNMLPVIETSIYAEMEHVIHAIFDSLESTHKMNQDIVTNNFQQFVTHAVTNYQSLRQERINILKVHNKTYQQFENALFYDDTFISTFGFQRAFDYHNKLIQSFHATYTSLLCDGVVLDTDKKIIKKVIEPNIKQMYQKINDILMDGTGA